MYFRIALGFLLLRAVLGISSDPVDFVNAPSGRHFYEISDSNWEGIKKGQWLIGIFHEESPSSVTLEKDWNIFALKCKEEHIKVGMIKAHENPELQVRFLAKEFPKVFHIDEGKVFVFPTPTTREYIVRVIKDKRWDELEDVSEFLDPFSVQLSVFSYLCSRALLLYNFEKKLIFEYSGSQNIVNAVFGMSFVFVGTIIGLMLSCFIQFVKFAVACCLKQNQFERAAEELEPEDMLRNNSTSQARGNRVARKYNSMKARLKLRKRKV